MNKRTIFAIPLSFSISACGAEDASTDHASVTQAFHGSSQVRFNFVKTADWGSGYNARVDITNLGPDVIQGWEAAFDMPVNVQVHVSSLPAEAWSIFNTVGIENEVRISRTDPSNLIGVGQTQSIFLDGSYRGAFGFPTRCRAVHLDTPVACNGSTDATAPSVPSNVRVFGTGSTLVDLVWDPAADDVAVTGYKIQFQTRAAPALEIGEVPATLPVTRARITGLVSQTEYSFVVSARDAAGNESTTVSSPATTTGVPGIAIAFATVNQWPGGGFQGEFRVRNDEGVPLDHWGATFTFTGSFQSVWNGQISRIGETQTFSLSAPAHNLVLDPGETAVVGVTGTFANPAAPPANFAVSAGTFAVRPLANPQPPCLGVSCPSGTHCEVPASGIPTCVSDS